MPDLGFPCQLPGKKNLKKSLVTRQGKNPGQNQALMVAEKYPRRPGKKKILGRSQGKKPDLPFPCQLPGKQGK